MNLDDRIRGRAFSIYDNDRGRLRPREVEDWLQAECEELALELAGTLGSVHPSTTETFDQAAVWVGADQIESAFILLAKRIQDRRKNSVLLRLIASHQDYLTNSVELSDAEAAKQGENALMLYRLTTSLNELVGRTELAKHSLVKELKDLFSEDRIAFETTEFNIFSAAMLEGKTSLPVTFIEEGQTLSPDLRVGDLAYVECKDLHPATRDGLVRAIAENLEKASKQLATAQLSAPLNGTGVCIDIPFDCFPLTQAEWQPIRDALSDPDGPTFVFISASGFVRDVDAVSFPVLVSLATRAHVHPCVQRDLIDRLTKRSFRLGADDFEICEHPLAPPSA